MNTLEKLDNLMDFELKEVLSDDNQDILECSCLSCS